MPIPNAKTSPGIGPNLTGSGDSEKTDIVAIDPGPEEPDLEGDVASAPESEPLDSEMHSAVSGEIGGDDGPANIVSRRPASEGIAQLEEPEPPPVAATPTRPKPPSTIPTPPPAQAVAAHKPVTPTPQPTPAAPQPTPAMTAPTPQPTPQPTPAVPTPQEAPPLEEQATQKLERIKPAPRSNAPQANAPRRPLPGVRPAFAESKPLSNPAPTPEPAPAATGSAPDIEPRPPMAPMSPGPATPDAGPTMKVSRAQFREAAFPTPPVEESTGTVMVRSPGRLRMMLVASVSSALLGLAAGYVIWGMGGDSTPAPAVTPAVADDLAVDAGTTQATTKPEPVKPALAVDAAPPKVDVRCQVKVTTEPAGARIYWRRKLLGKSPVDTELDCGKRRLTTRMAKYQRGSKTLELTPDEPAVFDFVLERPETKVNITSRPSRAKVMLGDKVIGKTPIKNAQLPAYDELELKFTRRGYRDTVRKVTLKPSKRATAVSAKLRRKRR